MSRPVGADLFAWTALRRVHRGGVVKVGERYLDNGCPVSGHTSEALDALAGAGLVVLAAADPAASAGQQRISLARRGRAQEVRPGAGPPPAAPGARPDSADRAITPASWFGGSLCTELLGSPEFGAHQWRSHG